MEQAIGPSAIAVDQELCMGSGYCVRLQPRRFELNSDGICQILGVSAADPAGAGPVEVSDGELDALEQAVDVCPSSALTLETP
ncbi:ferredoxin [Mycobacteroides abscessus]|uniref:ferredoxin n=1 Tax=Mycobacteroides abscessus TaxID=36809 RepID=UPI00092BC796|nr:ferredoxin [Mycobacteroides abscessus]SHO98112.1 Protein of uncharacterised function (DUF1271) [Mycobacteroides abscessus subsp. abscessus]SHS30000.1 Protein of uncharacterised function (DUF1271) [Mycobacteroides abscessus subsp. abscessus]SHS69927.1 Protein of uncharacterised function (DUF1271) [Mycobacteroides abscessus subsp. abscessus]SKD78687.1 Protein of uncharacterised function (DUF1271) [Mycobacteroides abscessus subsp. abscessus]SKG08715.1 Protein of uncharacterised function (DUF12